MKTRFKVAAENISNSDDGLVEQYNKYYKESGFILDEYNEDIYKDFDSNIVLSIGDYITVDCCGLCIITWKCYDLNSNIMTYSFDENV